MDADLSLKKKLNESRLDIRQTEDDQMDDPEIEEIELTPVETIVWDCTEAYLEKNLPRLLKDIMQNNKTDEHSQNKRKKSYGK